MKQTLRGLACAMHCSYSEGTNALKNTARRISNALNAVSGPFAPEWIDKKAEVVHITSRQDIVHKLEALRSAADNAGADVIFCYIIGHGRARRGNIFEIETSLDEYISLYDIVGTLTGLKKKRLVICCEACRIAEGNPESISAHLRDQLGAFISSGMCENILLIFSTQNANATRIYNGGYSPFSQCLSDLLSDMPFLRAPRGRLSVLIRERMETLSRAASSAQRAAVTCTLPDIHSLPKESEDRLTFFGGHSFLSLFPDKIAAREWRSLKNDAYLQGKRPWQRHVHHGEHRYKAEIFFKKYGGHCVLTGPSGSGKTKLAQWLSLNLAEQESSSDGKRSLGLYINAGRIALINGSGHDILRNFLNEVRYEIRACDSPEAWQHALELFSMTVFLDIGCAVCASLCQTLQAFVNWLSDSGVRIVILCEPDLRERADEWITHSDGVASSVTLSPCPGGVEVYGDLAQKNTKYMQDDWPLYHQRRKRSGGSLMNNSIIILDEIKSGAYDVAETDMASEERLQLLSGIALHARNLGHIQELPEEAAIEALERLTSRPPKDVLNLLVAAKLLRQDRGEGTPLRFRHRQDLDVLIAHRWIADGIDVHQLYKKSTDLLWEGPIADYICLMERDEVLVRRREDMIDRMLEFNPHCIVLAVNRGILLREEDCERVAKALLEARSHWTRSAASRSLACLCERISNWMVRRLKAPLDLNERTTIAMALGESGSPSGINVLKLEYANALGARDYDSAYFRRRILDALRNNVTIEDVKTWTKSDIVPREWVRIVRSTRILSRREYEQLCRLCDEKFDDETNDIGWAFLLWKRAAFERASDADNTRKMIAYAACKALKSSEYCIRCFGALLMGDARLDNNSASLATAFDDERNLYAKGDMAYVLGGIGHKSDAHKMLGIYASMPDEVIEAMLRDMKLTLDRLVDSRQGFLNDVALGLRRSYDRGLLSYDDFIFAHIPEPRLAHLHRLFLTDVSKIA